MTSLPKWFFVLGVLFALIGMAWGIQMSATHDHTLSPAHGHLNLVGFVAFSVFGSYYALSPSASATGLAKLHFALSILAVVVLVPGIAMAITENGEALAKIGSILALLSMALFGYVVLRHGVGDEQQA